MKEIITYNIWIFLILLVFIAFYFKLDFDKKYLGTPKEILDVLNWGEMIIKAKSISRGRCVNVDFREFPELKKILDDEIASKTTLPEMSAVYLINESSDSCLADAKLVQLSYPIYTAAVAVYRCEQDGIGEELKLSSHQDSCGYMQYRTEWNIPVGKYTSVSTP